MDDIAKRAGVSTATVSMSLRNKPNIPVATRERIRGIAEALGYQPNPFVSALMRSRRRGRGTPHRPVLALVTALEEPDAWRNSNSPTRRLIHEGASARIVHHGYQVQEFWLGQSGMSPERFSSMLHARGIEGLLIGPLQTGAAPPALRWEHFSAVMVSVPKHALTVPTVGNDHYFSSHRAVTECHRLGYRRPGLVLQESHRAYFQGRWEAGFLSAQAMLPDVVPVAPFYPGSLRDGEDFDEAAFERWLKKERPDVVVTMGAEFIERKLQKFKLKVPRDIGIAGLAVATAGERISGVYQNGRRIGATAVDVLVAMVERHEKGLPDQAVATMVEGLWNEGATLRPQQPAAEKIRPARRK